MSVPAVIGPARPSCRIPARPASHGSGLPALLGAALLLALLGSAPALAATLSLTKTAPASVNAGETFDYQLSYTCTAVTQGENCTAAKITDVLPAGVEVVSCSGNAAHQQLPSGVSCSAGLNRTVTFFFSRSPEPANQPGTLPAGSTGTLIIRAKFTQGTTPNGFVAVNTASFTASNAPTVTSTATTTAVASDKATVTKTRLSSASVRGEPTLYRLQFCQPANSHLGGLNATGMTLTEQIPAGASYLAGSASDGGVFVPGSPPDTPDTVVWSGLSLNVSSAGGCLTRYVQVLFPADFSPVSPTPISNVMTATYTPVGEGPKMLQGQATHTVLATGGASANVSKSSNGTLADPANTYPINQTPGFEWRVNFSNNSGVTLRNVIITDSIPKQAVVNRISVGNYIPTPSIRVQYRLENDPADVWHDLPGNPYTAATDVPVTALDPAPTGDNQITAVRWLFGDVPSGFQRPTGAYSNVRVTFQNPDRDGGEVLPGTSVTNSFTLTADNLTSQTRTNSVTTSAGVSLTPRITKTPTSTTVLVPGQTQVFTLTLTNNSLEGGPDLPDPVILDTLPAPLEYVSHTISYGAGVTPPAAAPAFSQSPGGGGTVLRWVWDGAAAVSLPRSRTLTINLTVRARGGAAGVPGLYVNRAALSGAGSAWVASSCVATATDNEDLDQDGNSTETLCLSGNAPVNLLASAALNSVKEVRGGCAGSSGYGAATDTFGNGPVDYRLTVSNPGNVAVDQAVFYDIFPWVGDRGVIATAPRDSEWAPVLTGAVAVPSGATVYYSSSTNPCRPELFGGVAGQQLPADCTNDWTTVAPTDITRVKALRVDFGAITIAPEDALRFAWPMRAPVAAGLTTSGNNSFGYIARRTDGLTPALQAAEPNLVTATLNCAEAPPFIGDFVWQDSDQDGLQDPDEPGLNGIVVALYRPGADGVPGGGDDSLVATTVSAPDGAGNQGYYRFGDLLPGAYYLVFTRPAGWALSPQSQGADPTRDADADPQTGQTPVLTVQSGDERIDLDAGLFPATTASIGNYVWIDRNADGVQNESPSDGLNGVRVQLLDDSGAVFRETVTADDSFGNPGAYLFQDVPPGTYALRVHRTGTLAFAFTEADRGNGGNDSRILTDTGGSGDGAPITVAAGDVRLNQDAGLLFPTGNLALGNRVWRDTDGDGVFDAGESGIDGVTVMLYRDLDEDGGYSPGIDLEVGVTTTFTRAGVPGFYEFTGLPAGAYLLRFPAANFAPGGALAGLLPSFGSGWPPPDPDNDRDDNLDQNAWRDANGEVVTGAITLSSGGEPGGGDLNHTLDAGFLPLVAIGNLVFRDANGNGRFDPLAGDTGIDGVTVHLYRDGDTPGATPPRATTVTAGGGLWLFDLVPEGRWFVHVPADQFGVGGPLAGLESSPGAGGDTALDDDQDENGLDSANPAATGITSNVFALTAGALPTAEAGVGGYAGILADASVNLTADFGFRLSARQACIQVCDVTGDGMVTNGDLTWIGARRGQRVVPAGASNSGDANRDGVLSINDVRACTACRSQ